MKKITKFELLQAFFTGGECPQLGFKVINAIEREDGSNHCYNITGIDNVSNVQKTLFAVTID